MKKLLSLFLVFIIFISISFSEISKELLEKAKNGDPEAQYEVGDEYAEEKNYKKAFEWYKKAAEQGYARAQYNFGVMYEQGPGTLKDYKKAVKWYKKAAEQGYAQAQYNLGVMYSQGQGTLKDYKKALKWYQKAAKQGLAIAQYNLGVMYYNGYGTLKDKSKAKYWIKKTYENPDGSSKTKNDAKEFWEEWELWKY